MLLPAGSAPGIWGVAEIAVGTGRITSSVTTSPKSSISMSNLNNGTCLENCLGCLHVRGIPYSPEREAVEAMEIAVVETVWFTAAAGHGAAGSAAG